MRRLLLAAGGALGALALTVATALPASAHAIVDLSGDPAYAGQTSVITLEVQHGCLQNSKGIDKVAAYFDTDYRKIKPRTVTGWSVRVKHTSHGTKVVWHLTGDVPAFNTPTYFPMKISWPRTPGVYGVPVKQWCGSATNVWDVPDGPATANQPSPPLYPLPQIKVLRPKS